MAGKKSNVSSEHPFGAFTNNSRLSQIYYDTILRNVILSRINVALTIIQDTMIELDQFAKVKKINKQKIYHFFRTFCIIHIWKESIIQIMQSGLIG